MKIEDKWFERVATDVRTPCSSLVISDTIVKRFKDLIQQDRENFTVDSQLSPRFLYSDLRLLVGQHWLTFEVMETLVKIFNRSEHSFTKIHSFLYVVDLETNRMFKEEIIDWNVKSIDKICIIANVGLDILGNTFVANSKQRGNHWNCFVIDIIKIYNYNSLGWKISLNLNKTIEFINGLVKDCYQCFPGSFFLESVHSEQTHSGKTKKCNQECYQNAPFQGPNIEICRVICLLSIFLIAYGTVNHDSRSLPESVRWLHKVYNYGDYARYVLIKWYLQGKACITDILTQDKPSE